MGKKKTLAALRWGTKKKLTGSLPRVPSQGYEERNEEKEGAVYRRRALCLRLKISKCLCPISACVEDESANTQWQDIRAENLWSCDSNACDPTKSGSGLLVMEGYQRGRHRRSWFGI